MTIQKKLAKWGKRNAVSRRFHANGDKAAIASWRLELDKSLQVFKVRSVTCVKRVINPPRPERDCDKRKCGWFRRPSRCRQHPSCRFWRPERPEQPHRRFWRTR